MCINLFSHLFAASTNYQFSLFSSLSNKMVIYLDIYKEELLVRWRLFVAVRIYSAIETKHTRKTCELIFALKLL